ncbi:uncharacterized protein LOC134658485 [Cydia amplana]|uniref:uncharacterized protein LOC134658485 n=1 Tax=Cydia amplana TaxID=1869771 RepID=UPI002FE5688C
MDNQSILNVICAYAPQVGCKDLDKEAFWEDLDEVIINISDKETKLLLGDLNGHVGAFNSTYSSFHGGYGYGTINKEGEKILGFASRHNFVIINTAFQKKDTHLITYSSGGNSSQIDYILADKKLKCGFRDCKVIPGESLTSQHRLLVAVLKLPKPIKMLVDRTPKIKWKELTGPKGKLLLSKMRDYLAQDMETRYQNADSMWSKFQAHCTKEARTTLGVSKGGVSTNKDPSWWDDRVKEALRNKKDLFKIWQSSRLDHDRDKYMKAKKDAKRCVAQTRAEAREGFYRDLENAKTDADIFKVAKNRNRATLDVKSNKFIKSKNNTLLTSHEDINGRWFEYYNELLNEEFPSQEFNPLPPVQGPTHEVTIQEVKQAVNKMKNRKALGPDEIPADLWKAVGPSAIEWLTKLFNIILETKSIPEAWRQSPILQEQRGHNSLLQLQGDKTNLTYS